MLKKKINFYILQDGLLNILPESVLHKKEIVTKKDKNKKL